MEALVASYLLEKFPLVSPPTLYKHFLDKARIVPACSLMTGLSMSAHPPDPARCR